MDEYISRKEAIDKMRSLQSRFRAKNDWDSGYDTAIAETFEHIKRVPVADVQPVKHGRWGLTNNPNFRKCSECDAWWSNDIVNNCFTNYCPKCGARMYLEDGETNG